MLDETKSERNQVVAHFKSGTLLKGYTLDFVPEKETFHLTSESATGKRTIYEIRMSALKALFFVKTLEGDKNYKEKKRFEEADTSGQRGLKIKVVFSDGETIRGISLGYSKQKKGFFITPVDLQGNNIRIYILMNAVKEIKVGSEADK